MTRASIGPPARCGESIFAPEAGRDSAPERVIYAQDRATGLKAIISVHSTALGPAYGGTRFFPYGDEQAALTDVLRLSRGMTYKAAVAGLDVGGGKAVIIGDPAEIKTPALLEAYGELVESLGGTFITGGDVGTTSEDVDIIGRRTEHVGTRTLASGGSGDSGPLTAFGVFQAMRAAASHVWGAPTLQGRCVGVEGLGKVGFPLARLLVDGGAEVIACDLSPAARDRVQAELPGVRLADDVASNRALDVYAPCALGATLSSSSARSLSAKVVCGAANNQLVTPDVEVELVARGITWVPDYVASAGGLIQGVVEKKGGGELVARQQVERVFDTVDSILSTAKRDRTTAGRAAQHIAQARLDAAARAKQHAS
jgi:valine dehydrogenase (NAD+)